MISFKKRSSLLSVLVCLTILSISAQVSLFVIHTHASELVDALVGSSILDNIFHTAILLPIIEFISIQIIAYLLVVSFIWFIAVSCSEVFRLSSYGVGIFFWIVTNLAIFVLNEHYFPASFFAYFVRNLPYKGVLLWATSSILVLAVAVTYYHLFRQKRRLFLGSVFLILAALVLIASGLNYFFSQPLNLILENQAKPNIILIGLDSLRPDFTGYFGKHSIQTPNIDQFLRTGVTFTDAYTPLARTFPAWVSILTAKYPKHNHARINLSYAEPIMANDTLAKRLKAAGYETLYATDEKRFSNITPEYGFDQVIGPGMGLNDFLLGSLSDFPLSNLMINLPMGQLLFPYNYANRAAAITYEPDKFLQLVKRGLGQRQKKPLFLALHFCVTHWPFTWANDHQGDKITLNQRYQSAVEKVDAQLGALLQILKDSGLLEHSLLVLLSDHGTTFGLLGDRVIDKQHYQGPQAKLKWMTVNKLSSSSSLRLNFEQVYSLNTAYGQGTDVLSLKQYQVLLAFKYFGEPRLNEAQLIPHTVSYRSSLLDIAPTILDYLKLLPMENTEGMTVSSFFHPSLSSSFKATRPLYLETGYSISEIETNQIEVEKVLRRSINLYQVNPKNGCLFIKPAAESGILDAKQRAVLMGPWLLARYPASSRNQLIRTRTSWEAKSYLLPAYYVLANIKTGQWTIGFDQALAKRAPLAELQKQFKTFYGDEI